MICKNCGQQNAENSNFCERCGARLAPENVHAEFMYSQGQILATVKSALSSPLMLIQCIIFTLYIAVYITDIFAGDSLSSAAADLFGYSSMYSSAYILDSSYALQLAQIAGIISTIFIAIGLWITFASAAGRKYSGMSTSGLSIIKIIVIIRLVAFCIIMAVLPFMILAVIRSTMSMTMYGNIADESYYFSFLPFAAAALIFWAAMFVLIIIYMAKSIGTVNTIMRTINTAAPSDKVSGYAAVFNFIFAAYNLSLAASSLSSITYTVSCLLDAAVYIIFGIMIFRYKERIRRVMSD